MIIFRTLMRIFPNAKVVLTVRDPEKWYESVRGTIYQTTTFMHGTIALFLKLVGMFRPISLAVQTSKQGPPITKLGKKYIF